MTHELSCEEVIEKLLEFLDRELDPTTEREMARHMETCRACFSRAEFERRLQEKVRETAKAKAPERLRRRVRAVVARF